jgi:RNA polymerase sigma factor (sigma-70 family)
MPQGFPSSVCREFRALFTVGTLTGLSDGQLLERFTTLPGEAAEMAFTGLVERHGPMVWRVCRRILRDSHDAQDAFQATFLVLVKKARSLRHRDSVGNWLYGVAARVALDARATKGRQQHHERHFGMRAADALTDDDLDRSELAAVLHEELLRLPERYRIPLVLCYLEGLSHEEAALRSGRPVGTVRSRLARGREKLRVRLARRGIVPVAGAITAALSADASAVMSQTLVHLTVRAATSHAAQTVSAVSIQAAALTQGVLQTMWLTQLKGIVAAGVLVGGLVASGAGVLAYQDGIPQQGSPPTFAATDRATLPQVVRSIRYDVFNRVPGEHTVKTILSEGSALKKGDLVCELDSSAFSDLLKKLQLATKAAEAAYLNAKLTRQVAEMAVSEYREGILLDDAPPLRGEVAVEAADLTHALDRAAWSKKMYEKGYVSKAQKDADEMYLKQANLAIRNKGYISKTTREETKRSVLQMYVSNKTIKQLESEVEKARSDELAKHATWELERAKLKKLERIMANCRLHAPANGELRLAPGIHAGALVRQNQLIFRVLTEERVETPQ